MKAAGIVSPVKNSSSNLQNHKLKYEKDGKIDIM